MLRASWKGSGRASGACDGRRERKGSERGVWFWERFVDVDCGVCKGLRRRFLRPLDFSHAFHEAKDLLPRAS